MVLFWGSSFLDLFPTAVYSAATPRMCVGCRRKRKTSSL